MPWVSEEWYAAAPGRQQYSLDAWRDYYRALSGKLSFTLRFGATMQGLEMRTDAFVKLEDLLALREYKSYSKEDIESVVMNCPKQRYFLYDEEGTLLVRAQQGHDERKLNIKLDHSKFTVLLTKRNCPQMAVHGTFHKNLASIMKDGLKRGSRDHIHISIGLPEKIEANVSGCRAETDTFLHIDIRKAMDAGIVFVLSGNKVLLTPGNENGVLLPEFIRGATDQSGTKVICGFGGEAARPSRIVAAPDLTLAPLSDLTLCEREFLKAVKNFRTILKLEEQHQSGQKLEKLQVEKLERKSELLAKLAEAKQKLPVASEQLAKNADVLAHLSD